MGEYMPIESQNHVYSAALSIESGPSEPFLEDDESARIEQLNKEVSELRKKETSYTLRLNEAKSFWENKVKALQDEVKKVQGEAQAREVELSDLQHPHHEAPKKLPGPKCLRWVVGPVFSSLTIVVILANVVVMFMQHFYKDWMKPFSEEVLWVNNFFLGFYILELTLKLALLHCKFFCGPMCNVCWNWLDLTIVLVGIADQWVLPVAIANGYIDEDNGEALVVLKKVRLFRLARVLKVLHSCAVSDLSWTEGPRFQLFMMGVIAFNSLTLAMQEDYNGLPCWPVINNILLVIYLFELIARLNHWGCRFFCHPGDWHWNWLDFIIVVGGMVNQWLEPAVMIYRHCAGLPPVNHSDIIRLSKSGDGNLAKVMMILRLARLLRILRLVRLVRSIQPLYTLVLGIVQAMQGMVWVMILTALFLYIWALLGVVLIGRGLVFGESAPTEVAKIFPSVPESMYVFFKVMNGDMGDLEPLFEVMPIAKLFCVAFMVLSSWAILSILTAVVSENMINATEKHRAELEQDTEAEKQERSRSKLTEIFLGVDANHSDSLSRAEFEVILEDTNRLDELSEACGLEKGDMVHIFDLLSTTEVLDDGSIGFTIKRQDFVEGLQKESSTVTERAVMRLEKRLSQIEKHAMIAEQRAGKDGHALAAFMEAVEQRLDSIKDTVAGPAEQVAQMERRMDAGNAAAERAVAASAEQAAEMKRMLARLEQQVAASTAAAQQAQAAAQQAQAAAEQAARLAAEAVQSAQQAAQQAAQQVVASCASGGWQPMASAAAADEALAAGLSPERQVPATEVELPPLAGDGLEAAAGSGQAVSWDVKMLLQEQEDPPLPVPRPRFAASQSAPAGTGEEPIGSVRGVGESGDRSDEPADPLEYLLH